MTVVNHFNARKKDFMMTTKNATLLFSIVSTLFFSPTTFAQSNLMANEDTDFVISKNDDVLNYLRKNIAKSTILFEEKITYCEKKKLKDKFIVFDTEYLKSINATRNEVMTGLVYWDYKNTFNCERDARLKFAFDVSTLASAQMRYQLESKETLDIAAGFAYPSVETLEHLANYSKLPIKLKEYLEKTIGDDLFNVLISIEKLELPRQ